MKRPVYMERGTYDHLRWLVTETARPFMDRLMIFERPEVVEVWVALHWWCWLALGALHLRTLHRLRQALSREAAVGIRYDIHVF